MGVSEVERSRPSTSATRASSGQLPHRSACPVIVTGFDRLDTSERCSRPKAGLKTRLYGAASTRVQVKLAALFSLPGAPVNFGHFGHSHSGRERLALALPSTAVSPVGA